jgi:hypothetical protein
MRYFLTNFTVEVRQWLEGFICFLQFFNEICTTIFELKKNALMIDAIMVKLTRSTQGAC